MDVRGMPLHCLERDHLHGLDGRQLTYVLAQQSRGGIRRRLRDGNVRDNPSVSRRAVSGPWRLRWRG